MKDFLNGLTGEIILPFEPIYEEARQGFNSAIQQYPLIIVYCMDKEDVANAIQWSRKHGVPIRIRSGGHNYEGYSNGDCTLIIDISKMNDMHINKKKKRLYVQAGVTNMQVYKFLSGKGYPFPGGTCPTVGVSGYSLGGGWGLSCRYFGLGCDNLVEIELINYDGDLIVANRDYNEDLFWALRGAGGGNFGVVVALIFKLPPKVNNVTLIEIDYLHVTQKEQETFLQTWQEWFQTADNRMTLISRIYNSEADGLAMLVRGFFYGNTEEAKEMIKDFLELKNAVYNIEYLPFIEAVTIIGSSYPESEKFASGSRFVLRNFNISEINKITALIKEPPEGSVFAGISMYALGGRVSELGINETAFFYRNAKFIIWLETVWEDNEYAKENKTWLNKQFPTLEESTTGSYVNFPYGEQKDYLENYYGCHKVKLRRIKTKYDPFNIFSFPQGIFEEGWYNTPIASKFTLQKQKKESSSGTSEAVNYRGFRYVSMESEQQGEAEEK
jgi:hypothetical protein